MGWDRSGPTNPKYRTRQHRELRAHWARKIKAGDHVECTATVCLMPSRQITNPNGRARDGLHLGHNDDGTTYAGPQHNACNVTDGARRGNARSKKTRPGHDDNARRWAL